MTPVEKRRAIYHQKQLAEARAIDECLTVILRKPTSGGVRRQVVTPSVEATRRQWQDWVEQCPIRVARGKRHWTIAMLAAFLGVGERTALRWEHGMRPNAGHLADLARVLGDDLPQSLREWRASWAR